jgi:signal transduction histidine kinase/ligand-binding sensor domain-containing protein/CheY-like chemotaxis protein
VPARTLRFEHLSVDQGLAQESVLAIAQDTDGFMWIGSQAGLSRFDGYRVVTYRNEVGDPHSLANNWVKVLHVDRSGRMWIGTDGGLELYHPVTQKFIHYRPSEPAQRGNGNRHIRAIVGDGRQGLWLATSDGLQHFDPATAKFTIWHHVPEDPDSLADDQVNALAVDAGGRLWVGTSSGLDSLAPGARAFVHHSAPDADVRYNNVQALLVDAAQTLWIGSLAGLERTGGAAGPVRQRLGAAHGIRPGYITNLYQDVDGNVWVGTHADGLYRWDQASARFAGYRHLATDPHSVADNQISALYRDRVGTFWVGTWYAGVSRVDLNSGGFARIVRQADAASTLSDNKVRAILDDGRGKLWLGTNHGLNHYDPASGATRVYRHDPDNPNSLADLPASAIARDKSGMLWIGGGAGVTRFDEASGRFTRQSLAHGDPDSDHVRGMLTDRAGIIWITSRGGLHRLDPATRKVASFRHNPDDDTSLADNMVRPLLEDRRGQLWIGTFDGLDLLDRSSGKFRHFRHDPADPASLSHDEVHYLLEDSKGTIWIGTAAGLNRMSVGKDGKVRFRRYTVKDGLADDAIAAILEDTGGSLWISTNTGISRFDPGIARFRNYSAGDGTIEGAYFDGSALRAADGTLYFGGFNGVTAFNPGAISDNLSAPRAVITGFQIFNQPVALARPGLLDKPIERATEITLAASDSVFSLEFSALHYAAPQRNRFAYRLEGFDEGWVNTEAGKRFATYTNLDPGTYTFRVKAANKDGVWSASSAALSITILPPLWKTWWFRTLAVALVLGSAWGAYRFRLSGLRRQKALLEIQVHARTEEIAQQNRLLEQQKRELEAQRLEAENQRAEAERRRADAERQKEEVERQKENVELAHRNISILSEIGREMTATLDMETIMTTVYRHVHQLMDARIFGIGFYREEVGLIEFPFAIDEGVRSLFYTRDLDDPDQFAVWCLTHRREVFINDLEAEYDNYIGPAGLDKPPPVTRMDGSPGTRPVAMMYVPLIVKERMMGVLCVQSAEKNAYRRVHLDMLQTLAAHAAVALDNARAYRQLEETQAQLLEQERRVRQNTDELAQANRSLQENDERLRLAKRKAEDATRQKSEFLANMSHEMRTPLAGVIGMLGFALRDGLLQPGTREQILRGQANAQSLLTIINDLLDFSKIEAGKLTIENIDFALAATIDNVASLFEEQAAAHSIEFGIELAGDLPRFVVGDPMRLRQVLVNLVGNAFKFTNAGQVRLLVERLPAEGVNMIRFSVQDTGIGIARDAIERLFQKFEQADSTTTRRYGGTGLGLAICRQLVGLMGGDISVDSREGEGSTFSFVLPLADGVAPPLVPQAAREPHTHRLNVLCAEDFPTNQIIVRMMLEDLGHRVDIADNGELAVAACAATRYDLILMDGRMPEMDGASATRLIRAGGPPDAPVCDQELMIIALTANASEEDRSRYLAAGMDDFLTKPIDEAALHLHLSRAIERQMARGLALEPMPQRPPRAPSTSELDAMFGVVTGPTPLAVAAAQNADRRSSDLKARMRVAFAGDVPSRRADLETAVGKRDHEAAARLLHGIKGSAAYLDAAELHLLCGELEAAADACQWQAIEAALPRLRGLLGEFDVAPTNGGGLV